MSHAKSHSRRAAVLFSIALACVAAAALAVRAICWDDSLWLDELHTSWVVGGRWSDVARRAAAGNQGPLYFWALWLLTRLLPSGEIALRSLSWAASGGLVLALGWYTRTWTASCSLGLLAALLAAGDPNCVYYGREARPYACVALLALWHVVVFRQRLGLPTAAFGGQAARRQLQPTHGAAQWLLAVRDRLTGPRALWIALSWALFYTHYTSMLLLPAELLFVVVSPYRRRILAPRVAAGWLTDLVCIAVGCLPAMPQLGLIFQRRDNWSQFVKPQSWTALGTTFPGTLYVAVPLALALLVAVHAVWRGGPLSTRRLRLLLPLLVCWYLVPVGTAWLLTRWSAAPLMFRRYVWVAVVPLLMHPSLWGTLPTSHRGRRWFAAAMVVAAVIFWSSRPRETWTRHSHEDWRSAVARIAEDPNSRHWPVWLQARLIEDHQLDESSPAFFQQYCTFVLRGLYSLEDRTGPIIGLPSDPDAALTRAAQRSLLAAGGAWFVRRGSAADAQKTVDQWRQQLHLAGMEIIVEPPQSFGRVTVIAIHNGMRR